MIQRLQQMCIIVLFALVPLMVTLSSYWYVSPIFSTTFEIATHTTTELYAKGKWLLFCIAAVALFAVTVVDVLRHRHIHMKRFTLLIMIVVVTLLVSTYSATESYIAFWGVGNRYDGAITYILLLAVLWSIVHSDVKLPLQQIVYMTIPFTLINVVLLFLHTVEIEHAIGRVGSTVANANVASSMFAMLAILTIGYWLVERKHWVIPLIALNIAGLFLSISAVGFLVFSGALVILAIYMKHWKRISLIGLAAIAIALLLNPLNERIVEESFGLFLPLETSLDERLETKLQEPVNLQVGYDDGYPVLPAINTTALSSREYIWDKTLQLIGEKPLLGYGLDTLRIHFPHFNEDARAGISSPGIIVDKAHNMYIGFLYGAGLIATVAMLLLAGYIVKHFRLQKLTKAEVIVALVVLQFFMQGMTNDLYMGLNTVAIVCIAICTRALLRPNF